MKNKAINYEKERYIWRDERVGLGARHQNLLWEGFSSGPPQTIYALEANFFYLILIDEFRGA
jgi:hypothetical protein